MVNVVPSVVNAECLLGGCDVCLMWLLQSSLWSDFREPLLTSAIGSNAATGCFCPIKEVDKEEGPPVN